MSASPLTTAQREQYARDGFLLVSGAEGWYAFEIGETSEQTPWRPILWPFKMVVPLTCLLLMIQGFSELLKSLYMARTGIELEHKEKVEV